MKITVPSKDLLKPERFERVIEQALDLAAEAVLTDFQTTTRTWNHKPVFTITHKIRYRKIETEDKPYLFLNDGTRVRYAVMTKGFRAKSKVNWIGSRVGKGGVAFINRKHPMPGIEARNFNRIIGTKWQRRLPKIIQDVINMEAIRQI